MKKKAEAQETEEDIKDQDQNDTEEDTEESDDESDKEETEDSAQEDDESEEESEDDDKSSSDKKEELDLDAELEKERKAGEPDPEAASEAFRKRKKKREEDSDEDEEGDNKPLTQKDLDAALARDRKERQSDEALTIARGMAGSEKEAELIVAKWSNRTFPKTLTLRQQILEAYVITHSKKILGERDEALRALRGKRSIRTDGSGTHHDGKKNPNAPKLPASEQRVLDESGFKLNPVTRRYEKKLPNGNMLIRDSQTKQVRLVRKSQ